MISKKRYLSWSNWLILAFLSVLPFQPQEVQVNSIIIIALSLLSLLSLTAQDFIGFGIRSKFLWMPLMWIALALSLLWSEDVDRGLNSIFKSLPLILLPFVFSLQGKNRSKIEVWKMVFVASCLLASVIGLSSGLIKFAETGLSYHFSYQYVCPFLPPAYTSLYIALALAILIDQLRQNTSSSWWVHLGIWFFMIHLAVIFSRSGIVLLLLLIGWNLMVLLRNKLKRQLTLFLLLMVIGITALMTNAKVQDRISGVVKIAQGQYEYEGTSSSLGARMWIWNAARELVLDRPWLGYGAGGEKNALLLKFEEKELSFGVERGYNAHNQFMQYALAIGVLGLFYFLFLFWRSIRLSLNRKNVFGVMSMLFIALAFFTESMLERQAGIFLFAFFYSLIELQNSFAKTQEV
ncbi:O-antigen ligase family protein [Salibacteraceae bacterium]|nr:O-antigen ligase family protein [Salibacteraceae bacterium]